MSEQLDAENTMNASKNEAQILGHQFFDPDESYWPFMAALLSIIIFSMWALRSAFDFTTSLIVISCYSVISIISVRFKFRDITITPHEKSVTFFFTRSGLSWKVLVQAILGAAVPILLPWFVLNSAVPGSNLPADMIMLLAMIIYICLVPLAPSLGSISRIGLLKTSVTAEFNPTTSSFSEFKIDINPLDGHWFDLRNNEDFLSQIKAIVIEFVETQI